MLRVTDPRSASVPAAPGWISICGNRRYPRRFFRDCVRSTSRSASESQEISVSLQPFVPFLPAAAGPADTAALRCIAGFILRPASNVLPITIRRLARSLPLVRSSGPLSRFAGQSPFAASQAAQVGRLKMCATLNRYPRGRRAPNWSLATWTFNSTSSGKSRKRPRGRRENTGWSAGKMCARRGRR